MSQTSYVALLRGINVGINNRISMSDLKARFEELGYENVITHGNSGNVIFQAPVQSSEKLEIQLEKGLEKDFTTPISVMGRSKAEIAKVVEAIPKNWNNDPETKYDIVFLKKEVDDPAIVAKIGPHPSMEDLSYIPGTLFWTILKKDFPKSNFPKLVGTATYKGMTIRTPNVVRKILDLMQSEED
jgi:uncharacterized protein (DUF1697 family)